LTTRTKIRALALAASVALSGAIAVAAAPAVANAQNAAPAPPAPATVIKAKFEVISMLSQALQVRSLTNPRDVHTFSYANELRPQMLKVQSAGGYKYGDKVVVWYREGTEVALKIKGRPSKPR
jgi:membrane-bound inhibitor of C-type lysozyme